MTKLRNSNGRGVVEAVERPTQREIGWIAGFLEGEGSFSFGGGSQYIVAGQKQREPLERLQRHLGGSIGWEPSSDIWRWRVYGARARGLGMTIFPLMSPIRRKQILKSCGLQYRVGSVDKSLNT